MSRFLKALQGKNFDGVPPVWFMRQAGRYMSAYGQMRARHSFVEICKTPQLITEVTLQPIRRFGFDAAIIFSDILFILEAFGCGVSFSDQNGPHITKPSDFRYVDTRLSCLESVYEGVLLTKESLSCPLIGFSGAPFTLFAYAHEQKRMESCSTSASLLYSDPERYAEVFHQLEEAVTFHLCNQIAAGCDVVQIFDTWAGTLSPSHFQTYSIDPISRIIARVKSLYPDVPIILFAKGSHGRVDLLKRTGATALSLDWTIEMAQARKECAGIALQGNLDPALLLSSRQACQRGATELLQSMKNDPAFIFGLGHGVLPKTPEEHVEEVVRLVRSV